LAGFGKNPKTKNQNNGKEEDDIVKTNPARFLGWVRKKELAKDVDKWPAKDDESAGCIFITGEVLICSRGGRGGERVRVYGV